MPRSIEQSILLNQEQDKVFDALITPSSIKKWWFAASAIITAEEGGTYALAWGEDEDQPDYTSIARISRIEKPTVLVLEDYQYTSKEGKLPFDGDFAVGFRLEPQGGQTKLTVVQSGFPDDAVADGFYQGCVKGWEDTLASFKNVLES